MKLADLGYHPDLDTYRIENGLDSFEIGRVIAEHRERYMVKTETHELDAELIGNLRFSARDRSDFPAVGDWVALAAYDKNKALIHAVYPRKTIIARTAVGKVGEKQIIATNIDYALIVQAVDRDFNLNRMERYLAICYESGVQPILVLNKTDLISKEELQYIRKKVEERFGSLSLVAISNETRFGFDELQKHISGGKTYCLLGSSGVGKSSLLNNLSGTSLMKTNSISLSTHKGTHVTTHRELIVLEQGGILIDNPGMREVGIADASEGFDRLFTDLLALAQKCNFKNCTHVHESGCAILQAVEGGQIDRSSYENYLKMLKEKDHFESSLIEKKHKEKTLGKVVKDYKKFKRRNE